MSTEMDPDQNRRSVGPDLGPKQFAEVISRRQKSPRKEYRKGKGVLPFDALKTSLRVSLCKLGHLSWFSAANK